MAVSKHTRKGKPRRHVLRITGACVNGKHTGPCKQTRVQLLREAMNKKIFKLKYGDYNEFKSR